MSDSPKKTKTHTAVCGAIRYDKIWEFLGVESYSKLGQIRPRVQGKLDQAKLGLLG